MTDRVTDDAARVRSWVALVSASLEAVRDELDRANVFPVADADTGTNLCLTVAAGRAAVDALTADASEHDALAALVDGCRRGARGNSGTLLAEWLRALAGARDQGVATALAVAADAVHDAVGDPVEGTLLTVARAAGDAAVAAAGAAAAAGAGGPAGGPSVAAGDQERGWVLAGADPAVSPQGRAEATATALQAAVVAARDELSRTPQLLPLLRGTVDSGARGLVVVLESLAAVAGADVSGGGATMTRVPVVTPETRAAVESARAAGAGVATGPAGAPGRPGAPGADARPRPPVHAPGSGDHEVVLEVVAPTAPAGLGARLRDRLRSVGDSVAVAGGDGAWRVHVHADDPRGVVAAVDAVVGTGVVGTDVAGTAVVGTGVVSTGVVSSAAAGTATPHDATLHDAAPGAPGTRPAPVVARDVPAAREVLEVPAVSTVRDVPTVRNVEVRYLVERPHASQAPAGPGAPRVVAVTRSPGLLAELARAGAVALLDDPGHPLDDDALARAADGDPGGTDAVVLRPADSDLRLVAALAALATADPLAPTATRTATVRAAYDGLRVARYAPGEAPVPPDVLRGLARLGGEDVVLVLHGELAAAGHLDEVVRSVGRDGDGPEVVVLASGRHDAVVEVGWEAAPPRAGRDAS